MDNGSRSRRSPSAQNVAPLEQAETRASIDSHARHYDPHSSRSYIVADSDELWPPPHQATVPPPDTERQSPLPQAEPQIEQMETRSSVGSHARQYDSQSRCPQIVTDWDKLRPSRRQGTPPSPWFGTGNIYTQSGYDGYYIPPLETNNWRDSRRLSRDGPTAIQQTDWPRGRTRERRHHRRAYNGDASYSRSPSPPIIPMTQEPPFVPVYPFATQMQPPVMPGRPMTPEPPFLPVNPFAGQMQPPVMPGRPDIPASGSTDSLRVPNVSWYRPSAHQSAPQAPVIPDAYIPPRWHPESSRHSVPEEGKIPDIPIPPPFSSQLPQQGYYTPRVPLYGPYKYAQPANIWGYDSLPIPVSYVNASRPPSSWGRFLLDSLLYAIVFVIDTLPRQLYLHFLLRLPSFYFSRVTRIFEDAELSMPDIKRMALATADQWKERPAVIQNWATDTLPPTLLNFKQSWEGFIDSLMREWKICNVVSVLLLSYVFPTIRRM